MLVLEGTMDGAFFDFEDQTLAQSVRYLTSVDESGAFAAPALEEGAYTLVAIAEPGGARVEPNADAPFEYSYRHVEIRSGERISLDISF